MVREGCPAASLQEETADCGAWEEDKASLLCLPEYPFSVFRYAALTVNKSGFVTIETNKYGLSPMLSGETVQAKIFYDHVEFFHDHHPVGHYRRSYKTNDEVYDWTQYVSVLCKKPGAIEHTRFFTRCRSSGRHFWNRPAAESAKMRFSYSAKLYLTAMPPVRRCTGARRREWPHGCGQPPAVLLHDCKEGIPT
jgi:hypothetical protein